MKVGVLVEGQEGVGWKRWTEVVRWCEELGFESLWLSDHMTPLAGDRSVESLDAYVALTQAATTTSRIRIGTLVSPITVRHPVVAARTAAAIDALSGGRFELGMGTGWHPGEHEMFGIPLPIPRKRVRALDEGAAVVRGLLSGEKVDFDGAVFRLSGAQIRPASPVPLIIAGGGERLTLRTVARFADEWNLPAIPIEPYRRKANVLAAFCAQEGRDPGTIRRSLVFSQAIGDSDAAVRLAHDALIADTPPQYRPGSGPEAPRWLVGTPQRVVDELGELAAEGVHRVMLQYRQPPSRQELDLVADQVLPALVDA